jgi:hypothetical protein
MILAPLSVEDLGQQIASAPTAIGHVDLSHLNRILEHTPEDMTATVQTGMKLADFQAALAKHGQWVPLDPPGDPTIGDVLAHNLNGPRRYGYGTVREYVIGLRVVLGSGEIIRNGGKVVKNVAGYDLCRLFLGAKHTLGVIVEATFKLRPLPEAEVILQRRCASLSEAQALLSSLVQLEPVILDLHNLTGELVFVVGFAGIREDVEIQAETATKLGFNDADNPDYEPPPHKQSVLPSEVFRALEPGSTEKFVARLGNGIIYSEQARSMPELPLTLMRHVKEAFDPRHILPQYA